MTDRHGERPDDSIIEAAEAGHRLTMTVHDGYIVLHKEDGDVVVPKIRATAPTEPTE